MHKQSYGLSASDNDRLINKVFWQTLVVMTIAELSASLATLLDGVIIARFLSMNAIAAYGLTSPYTSMIKMIGGFFGTGTQIVYSRYSVKFEQKKANSVFSTSAVILTVFGCILAILMFSFSESLALMLGASKDVAGLLHPTSQYLKGLAIGMPFNLGVLFLMPLMNIDGDKKRIAISINVMMVTNLIGDLIVALLFDGNIFGMALTTSISCICAFGVLMLHFIKPSAIKFNIGLFRPNSIKEVSQFGVIPAVTRSFSMIRSYVMNIIVISLVGTGTLAANSLVQSNIKAVPVCLATAIGSTTLSLASTLYSEKDGRGLRQIFISTLKICLGPCLLITVLVCLFAEQIAMLFGAGEVAELTVQALRCFIIGLPIIGIKMFYIYYFQAAGNKKLSYYSSVAGEFVFLVVCAYVMIRLFGTTGLWLCYPVSELIYLISIFIIAAVKCGHIPHSIDDFLFLGSIFRNPAVKEFDVSFYSMAEVQSLSVSAMEFSTENTKDDNTGMLAGMLVEEVAANIFEHNQERKDLFVDLRIRIEDDSVLIRFRDNGTPFNPVDRIAMLRDDEPEHNIGLRIISRKSRKMEYVNVFNLNQFLIEIKGWIVWSRDSTVRFS